MIALLTAQVILFPCCGGLGRVEQGRAVSYDRKSRQVILIRDSKGGLGKPVYDVLPSLTVQLPEDPEEMGPEPQAGKLMRVDANSHVIVIFDSAAGGFRTIPYAPLEEHRNVAKPPDLPNVDWTRKTITIYSAEERMAITFPASEELLSMPADTFRFGDEIRYYYRDSGKALRLMNVSKTDLQKSGE
jgi:hypothetical protein